MIWKCKSGLEVGHDCAFTSIRTSLCKKNKSWYHISAINETAAHVAVEVQSPFVDALLHAACVRRYLRRNSLHEILTPKDNSNKSHVQLKTGRQSCIMHRKHWPRPIISSIHIDYFLFPPSAVIRMIGPRSGLLRRMTWENQKQFA